MSAAGGGVGHKYGARRTEYRGEWYPSAAEARRAMELDALQAAGEIHRWRRGTPIELIPRPYRVTYTPDFVVCPVDEMGACWLEDVKGMETPVFKLKAKLLAHFHPDLELRVLKVR